MSVFTIFVADTRHAKVFELSDPERVLRPIGSFENGFTARHERDLGADAPGRVLVRSGSRGSGAGGRTTALQARRSHKQHATEQFARQLAERVASAAHNGHGGGIVLVAAPRFLSEIRGRLPKAAQTHVVGELPRDLIDLPLTELRQRLLEVLRKHSVSA